MRGSSPPPGAHPALRQGKQAFPCPRLRPQENNRNAIRSPPDLSQHCSARTHTDSAPFSDQSLSGTLHCAVHEIRVSLADLRDHTSIRRVHVRELTRALRKLATDVVLDEFHVA